MESVDLFKTLILSQNETMKATYAVLPSHRCAPVSRDNKISDIEAHVQARLEIEYVLAASRIARHKALYKYNEEKQTLFDNAVHVLSTELLSTRTSSPEIV
jgi:hypothetical protein